MADPLKPAAPRTAVPPALAIAFALALALPALLAWNEPPSPTFLNQAAAMAGWCTVVVVLSTWLPSRDLLYRGGLNLLWWALGLLLFAALMSPVWAGLPWALSLSACGVIVAAGLMASMGAAVSQARRTAGVFRPLAWALVLAGLGSVAVAIVQIFLPQWADGSWIARSTLPGRAVGNLRQANHLATLLLWSLVALVWLGEMRLRRPLHDAAYAPTVLESRWAGEPELASRPRISAAQRERWLTLGAVLAAGLALVAGLVWSGSRTGLLGLLLLAAWGLADRRLTKATRAVLVAAPAMALAVWLAMQGLAGASPASQGLMRPGSDLSTSRFAIWSNTLELIAQNPLLGVGFGEFNFAWTLTPFPNRPTAFFDHTHNLPLQLMVELGVPLSLVVMALLLWVLQRAAKQALRHEGELGLTVRTAFVMVALMVLHSQLEYPLWYAHFLLPTAFLLGLCIAGQERRSAALRPDEVVRAPVRTSLMVALMGLAATAAAVWDYQRVVEIFKPSRGAGSLEQRIEQGRQSWFFAHHADYAAVTTAARPSTFMPAFDRAAHHLLDARLMRAWAVALDETNQVDRSRHLAQRLAEFRNPQVADFFAICAEPLRGTMPDGTGEAANGAMGVPASGAAGGLSPQEPPAQGSGSRPALTGSSGLDESAGLAGSAAGPVGPGLVAGNGGSGGSLGGSGLRLAGGASWVDMAASFPAPVPPRSLPKGPPTQPVDPAFAAPAVAGLPFQCLKPARALSFQDFR